MFDLKKKCTSYINGAYCESSNNRLMPNYFPANNQIINEQAYASTQDINFAVQSSIDAFKKWSKYSMNERSNILLKAASLLREQVNDLARVEVWDTGKPITEALTVDIFSAADNLEYFAKAALSLTDNVFPNANALIYTQREPLGLCVGIGAWNYPIQLASWKAAPALIMGNTMMYKPSEHTPMTALLLAEIFTKAGMPPGVFNVLLGDKAIAEQLLANKHIAKISFTGSVPTGKRVLEQAAQHIIPVTLELGGKSPFIVFDDADLEEAVLGSMLANFYTQGEICSNGTRVFVHKSIEEEFIDKLIAQVEKLIIGDPFDTKTQIGSLISPEHLNKVLTYIQEGKNEGADLVYGGLSIKTAPLDQGNFIQPTIFRNCKDTMKIAREEIFGPVMSIFTFEEEEEVIHRANNTEFGLGAGLFTDNIKRGHRVARQLEAGVCWINNYNLTPIGMPFGGSKQSGFGRENGFTALSEYSKQKSIYLELEKLEHPY